MLSPGGSIKTTPVFPPLPVLPQDVERVGLGKKSAAKVVELLETGESSRVQAAVADEHLQVGELQLG